MRLQGDQCGGLLGNEISSLIFMPKNPSHEALKRSSQSILIILLILSNLFLCVLRASVVKYFFDVVRLAFQFAQDLSRIIRAFEIWVEF
jgi:hypothetical protein